MAKRLPRQHETDHVACRQFEGALPASWVVRPQLKDYGVDFEVEIFHKGHSTGIIFKVQLKGTERPNISSGGKTFSLSLPVDDAVYLCEELTVPTMLVLADVAQKRTWWHPIQLDSELRERLAKVKQKSQRTVTVRIDFANELPATTGPLLKSILESATYLSARSVSGATPNTFLNAMASVTDLDQTLAGLRRGVAFVQIEKLDRLRRKGDFAACEAVVKEVLDDRTSSVEAKFAALLTAELISLQTLRLSGRLDEWPRVELLYALELRSICKGGPLHLRAFAALAVRAAQLHELSRRDYYLFMNAKVCKDPLNKDITDPLWTLMLPVAASHSAMRVTQKLDQCSRLLRFMVHKGLFHIIPRSTALVTMSALPFVTRLWADGMAEAAKAYEHSLVEMADVGIDLAVQLRAWDDASLIIMHAVWLCNSCDEASVKARFLWATERAREIGDSAISDETQAGVRDNIDVIRQFPSEGPPNEMQLDDEKQMYARMAESLGIDLRDPNDDVAAVVRVGILDLDPTRVLSDCHHLYIALSGGGMVARVLMLPTAGLKTLWCTRHGYGTAALRVDEAYRAFREAHCAKCGDAVPHPAHWRWSHAWQKEQDDRHGNHFKPL